ncbi:MAG TPA: methyltransferase domain-containing protein [Albidovulum sp.]|uniref:class I SAM-dependent methyltransferase n=1 Tax=Albidovulum sp. TaxID=1872424 RepID=UPI002D0CE848|nr:methyltransferase domain-containing protein [Albidovulum sp.]
MQTPDTMFQDGAAYERMMGRWSQRVGSRFLDWLGVAPGLDWLDAGCGNGAFTEIIAARAAPASLTGIDPSSGQIAFARRRPGAKGANFEVGDAQTLPFAADRFDVSVMALVIAFIPDPARAVAELARVTKAGGLIATYMWDMQGGVPLAPLHRALAAMGHAAPLPPSAPASSLAALETLWRGAGLTEIEVETFPLNVTFDSFDDFWQSNVQPVGPLAAVLRDLPDTERDRLRQHLKESLPTDADGRIAYGALANAVKGRRAGG